ncbi:MAG: flippase-like domain-containing protein [Planctomycetes bacterium]|nr:flippase-like domain-containing protein [Planctomycetota bacterium]
MAETNKKGIKRHLTTVLRILVAVGALYMVFRGEDFGSLAKLLTGLNPWSVIAAMGLYGVAQVLFVYRWKLLLRILSADIDLLTGLKLHFLGLFYNNCLPSSVGGDLLRAWYITRHVDEDKRVDAALSVFVDRVIGLTGMILMASFFYWLVPVDADSAQAAPQSGAGIMDSLAKFRQPFLYAVLAVIGVIACFLIVPKGRALFLRLFQRAWTLGKKLIGRTLSAVHLYAKKPLSVLMAIGLTVVLQSLCIIGFWLLGRDMGMNVHIKYYFVFFPVSWLIGTIPISVGGMGIMEGGVKLLFLQIAGVTKEQASAIAICQRLIWMVGSLPGIIIHLCGAHLPAEKEQFSVDSRAELD